MGDTERGVIENKEKGSASVSYATVMLRNESSKTQ